MEKNKLQRNSSIELLRIIAAIGVVILHYNNSNGGGGFKYVQGGSVNEQYLFFSESIFICAVNLFVMISAYFLATTQKRKFIKVIELLGQLILFKMAFYLISVLMGHSSISFSGIVRVILPNNYFVIFYLIVYVISPYINVMIKNISKESFTRLVVLSFFLFSVWTAMDRFLGNVFGEIEGLNTVGIFGDQGGYTIVNFMMIYLIGAYIRLNSISIAKWKSVIGIIVCIFLIYFEKNQILLHNIAWDYNNPIVVLMPVFLILLFKQIQFQSSLINELAKAAFTCYLFHGRFLKRIGVEKFANGNIFILILHQFGSAVAIYLISYVVYKIYFALTKPIIKRITPICDKVNISLD